MHIARLQRMYYNQVSLNWFCFSLYQTGLTQMANTVVGGSTGLGLSGGQVSNISTALLTRIKSGRTVD